MPQMSPMNWIMLSNLFIMMFIMMKILMNKEFKSKSKNSMKMKKNMFNMKW